MHRTHVVVLFLTAFLALAIFHNLAVTFYLYWTYLWFDIPMHILGGFVAALGYIAGILVFSGKSVFKIDTQKLLRFMPTMAAVFTIGVLWEVFEVSINSPARGIPDTALDLLMDLVGGAIGYYVATYNKRIV